jgi:hypothetical protein
VRSMRTAPRRARKRSSWLQTVRSSSRFCNLVLYGISVESEIVWSVAAGAAQSGPFFQVQFNDPLPPQAVRPIRR